MPKKPPEPAAPARSAKKVDWPAELRADPSALERWNKLPKASRTRFKLAGADFGGATLKRADLRGLKAEGASFAGAALNWAKLSGGRFAGANFAGADLSYADLTGADFAGADFTGAALTKSKMTGSKYNGETKWPAAFPIPPEVRWAGDGPDPRLAGADGLAGLMARLHATIDAKRMKRALDMLKKGKNQLFAEVESDQLSGVVRSQKEPDLVYSCLLTAEGRYACCTPDLTGCMGLRGELCKHLLVLLIGLTRAGELDPAAAARWAAAAAGKPDVSDAATAERQADTLLRYKAAQAGEIDWRPTETIPEDFYAL